MMYRKQKQAVARHREALREMLEEKKTLTKMQSKIEVIREQVESSRRKSLTFWLSD